MTSSLVSGASRHSDRRRHKQKHLPSRGCQHEHPPCLGSGSQVVTSSFSFTALGGFRIPNVLSVCFPSCDFAQLTQSNTSRLFDPACEQRPLITTLKLYSCGVRWSECGKLHVLLKSFPRLWEPPAVGGVSHASLILVSFPGAI